MAERTAIPGSIGRIAEALRPEDRCEVCTSCTLRTQCLFPAVEDQQDEKRRSSGTNPGSYQGERKRQEMSKTSLCLETTVECSSIRLDRKAGRVTSDGATSAGETESQSPAGFGQPELFGGDLRDCFGDLRRT